MTEMINYILTFLLYGNEDAAKFIGYTSDPEEAKHYKYVITPNGHLGKDLVLPELDKPLKDTDLVYNTFFFISCTEELLNPQRDEHGRFAARYSILGQHNRLQIPLIDEYSRFLMKTLDLDLPKPEFSTIYLTHDIDTIDNYRHLRGAIGGLLRGEAKEVRRSWFDIHKDPAYTFPWLIEQDHALPRAKVLYFVKHTNGRGYDYPQYNLQGKDWRLTRDLLLHSGASFGIHSSYDGLTGEAGQAAQQSNSANDLTGEAGLPPHRSHYLRCGVNDLQKIVELGFTDDFSIAFADEAGFRLQTTRPVRWINPLTYSLSPLTLHPLTVMDVTLNNKQYMNLTEDEAYFFCQRLFDKVKQNQGELVLLWHNNNINPRTYHRSLYPKLLSLLS